MPFSPILTVGKSNCPACGTTTPGFEAACMECGRPFPADRWTLAMDVDDEGPVPDNGKTVFYDARIYRRGDRLRVLIVHPSTYKQRLSLKAGERISAAILAKKLLPNGGADVLGRTEWFSYDEHGEEPPKQIEFGTGGPPNPANMYTADLLRDWFGDWELLHLAEHESVISEGSHHHGMSAILDVVYNHLGPEGCYLRDFGPYFTGKYRTPWGDAINYDDRTVVLTGPMGNHVKLRVDERVQRLNEVQAGDMVTVRYTEALSMSMIKE